MQAHCLCGAVRFTAPDAREIGACHCGFCRRWGGGPLLAVHCGADVQFSGQEHIAVYASSDWAERAFCSRCGTHLFYRLLASNEHFLSAGLFQDEPGMQLVQQIYIDEKPAYYALANATPVLTGAQVEAQYADPAAPQA